MIGRFEVDSSGSEEGLVKGLCGHNNETSWPIEQQLIVLYGARPS
jgi:hypothetical protein